MAERTHVDESLVARLDVHLDGVVDRADGVDDAIGSLGDLFVEQLAFDPATDAPDSDSLDLPVVERVTTLARRDGCAVVAVELDSLSRSAERRVAAAVDADEVIFAFHGAADRWHLVAPTAAGGRVVLRRHLLGPARCHRHVARSLAALAAPGPACERVDAAFDRSRLVEAFHGDYRAQFDRLREAYEAAGVDAEAAVYHAHGTLTRLLAVAFRAAADDGDGVTALADAYGDGAGTASFHDWLLDLFADRRDGVADDRGGDAATDRGGGPAEVTDALAETGRMLDRGAVGEIDAPPATLPDDVLLGAVRRLAGGYCFSRVEETPRDVDLAVTPSVLGKVHESLLTAAERDESGVFFTPVAAVDDACRAALFDHLRGAVPEADDETFRRLVFEEASPPPAIATAVRRVLDDVRVADPACGAGAFLVGMLRVLVAVGAAVDAGDEADLAARFVDESLHGVDVAEWAVRVASVRLELAASATGADTVRPSVAVGDSLLGGSRPGGDATNDAPSARLLDGLVTGGFDLVVGNPPYVPHQEIAPPTARAEEAFGDASAYRAALREYCRETWDVHPYRRSDLYVYFFFRGAEILRPGGTLAYLTSNAWLDVGYGTRLQEFLLSAVDLLRVVAAGRAVPDADVNAALTCLRRPTDECDPGGDATFLAPDSPPGALFGVGGASLLDARIDETDAVTYRGERLAVLAADAGRVVRASRSSLWRLGDGTVDGGSPRGRYRGGTWGALFLRAPDCFFSLADRGGDALAGLDPDRVETYLNTGGADDFFFLDVVDAGGDRVVVDTEDGRFEIESEYVVPVVESPRSLDCLRVDPTDPEGHLLVVPPDVSRERLDSQAVSEYVAWGESRGFDRRSGTRSRTRWEVLPAQARDTAPVLVGCYMSTPRVFYNPDEIISHRFFRYYPGPDRDPLALTVSLNSAVTLLSYELFRNPGLGGGVLAVNTDAIARFLVVDPAAMDVDREIAEAFLERPQGDLFEELGFDRDRPPEIQSPDPRPDRRAVDDAAFDALGVPREERADVYRALASLTRARRNGG